MNTDLNRWRKETSEDMEALLVAYLQDANDALRMALSKSADSLLTPEQCLPLKLIGEMAELRLKLNAELARRGRTRAG